MSEEQLAQIGEQAVDNPNTEVAQTEADSSGVEVETTETTNPAEPTEVQPTVIKASNATKEEMAIILASIKENYNLDVDVKPVEFRFKKTTDKETKIETVRETVELAVPYPSLDGIVHILEHGAEEGEETVTDDEGNEQVIKLTGKLQFELLQEAMADVVNSQAREILYDDTNLNAANFPVEKLSWEYIAKLPRAQRRGGGIAKETWEAFVQDYVTVMPAATNKTVEQCTNAAKILGNKLAQVKTNKAVLKLMEEMLAIYAGVTENLEEFAECVDFLAKKVDTLLNVTEEDLLANL